MSDEHKASLAVACCSFLYLNGFMPDSIHTQVHRNVAKYLKKHQITVDKELLDSVELKINKKDSEQ
jgi:mannose-6-phosphate isomerase class I